MPWRLRACWRCGGDLYLGTVDPDYHCLACGVIVVVDRVPVGEAARLAGMSRAELRARFRARHMLVYADGVNGRDLAALLTPERPPSVVRGRPRGGERASVPKPRLEWRQDEAGRWGRVVVVDAPAAAGS